MASTRTGPLEPRETLAASDTAPTEPDGAGARRPASASPFGPARIGRYEILEDIAAGGMGRVFLGRARGPLGFEKLVAIKTIHGELAREQAFVDMFFDEARIAARIDHENVCRVFDFGQADGQYFLAMEYLVGVNLGRVLRALVAAGVRDEGFDSVAAFVVAQAAEGLHAAHELSDEHGRPLGVVHRDVSPQNIFLTFDGGVRVVDFGIASAEGRRHQTATGSLKGKFAYMAPEQLRREKADRRADVWALGVVLWELLTWQRAFRAETEVETVLAVLNDPVRSPRSVRASVDPELDAIVMSALAKDREQRLPTARALSRALQEHLVRRGRVVGSAEVESFLARLLPDERRDALARVDEARRTPARASSVPPLAAVDPPRAEPRRLEARERTVVASAPAAAAAPRRSTVGVLLVGLGVPALLAIGVAGGVLFASSVGVDAVPSSSAPVAPASAPSSTPAPTSPVGSVGSDGVAPSPTPTREAATSQAPDGEAEPSSGERADPRPDVAVPVGQDPPRPERRPVPGASASTPRSTAPRTSSRRAVPSVAAPAAGTGLLVVTTPGGWAEVYADGRHLGRTPLTTSLPTGAVELELRPFTLSYPDDPRVHRRVEIGSRITQVTVPLGTDGRPR